MKKTGPAVTAVAQMQSKHKNQMEKRRNYERSKF